MADQDSQAPRARGSALALVLLWLGVVAAVVGVGYNVNGMTQARASVRVPVGVVPEVTADGPVTVQVGLSGVEVDDGWLAPAPVPGVHSGALEGELELVAWDSTRLEQALGRGDWLVGGLGLLAVAILLKPVLDAIARGTPFRPGNATRLVATAAAVAVVGVVAPLLPALAGGLVLARTGLAGTGRLAMTGGIDLPPLLVAAVLLALAGAFRRGEQLARDTEGLV